MDVVPPLISDPEATVLMQPTQGPLHHPAEDAQSTAVLRPPLGQHRLDPELTKPLPVRLRIVTSVALHPIGTTPGMARLALHRRDRVEQGCQPVDVGHVGPRRRGRQRDGHYLTTQLPERTVFPAIPPGSA